VRRDRAVLGSLMTSWPPGRGGCGGILVGRPRSYLPTATRPCRICSVDPSPRAGGLSKEEVRRRPIIGICSSWSELNPCNMGLRDLAEAVRCNELNAAYAADGYARIQGVGAVCTTFGWANSPR